MKRRGLLTGMILGLFVVAGWAQAQDVSVFTRKQKTLDHQYGIQIVGGGGTYVMDDVNAYRASDYQTGNANDASTGISWGVALLYRSHEHFRWTIGYSALGQDKADATWNDPTTGDQGINEMTVSGNEWYLMPSYLITFSDALNVSLGAGPAIYSGKLDRRSTSATSVYDAHGRAVGIRAAVGAELVLSRTLGIHFLGGYRAAKVGTLVYKDQDEVEQTLYWGNSNRTLSLDFSGVFVEAGVRLYFDPATGWFKM